MTNEKQAENGILVHIKRPAEGYEDVCSELILEDFIQNPLGFEVALVTLSEAERRGWDRVIAAAAGACGICGGLGYDGMGGEEIACAGCTPIRSLTYREEGEK